MRSPLGGDRWLFKHSADEALHGAVQMHLHAFHWRNTCPAIWDHKHDLTEFVINEYKRFRLSTHIRPRCVQGKKAGVRGGEGEGLRTKKSDMRVCTDSYCRTIRNRLLG